MSHTIVELFIKIIPTNLYRHGAKNSPQLHKIRTMPPRMLEQAFDIEIHEVDGINYVLKDTGGISTFDSKNSNFGNYWWVDTKGNKNPPRVESKP